MPSERVQRRIDRLLDDAESAADQHDWAKVLEFTSVVLHSDPENEDALEFKGMAEIGLNQSGQPVSPTAQSDGTPQTAASADSPRVSPQPTAFAEGRYTVSRFLGEGGKKKVYLAQIQALINGYIPHIKRIGEEKLDTRRRRTRKARRWVVERTFAWLSKCRAILVRYEKKARNYLGLVQLACALLWFRRYYRLTQF